MAKYESARWLTYGEALDRLGVARSTMDQWRGAGRLRFTKLPNGALRIRESDLESWLDSLETV